MILIVEHDSKMISEADIIFEIGPGPETGGEICFSDHTIIYYYQILLPGNFFERRVSEEKSSKLKEELNMRHA